MNSDRVNTQWDLRSGDDKENPVTPAYAMARRIELPNKLQYKDVNTRTIEIL